MKICIISTPFIEVNPKGYGGLEKVTANLGKGLAELGNDVTIVAPNGSKVEGCKIFPIGNPTGMNVNWREEEKKATFIYKDLIETENFDIILDSTWFSLVYGFKKLNPDQKIAHVHHGHLTPSRQVGNMMVYGWVDYVKQFTKTPNLIAISNWMKRLYRAQYKIASKTAHNGIDTSLFVPINNPECKKLLFVGRLDDFKCPHIAVEVAEKTGIPLDIVGSVDWSSKKEYANNVIQRAKKNNFGIHLEATEEKKIELYQNALATLVPSQMGEPFGLVAAESMSCGTPIIYLDDGGLNEISNIGGCDTVKDMIEIATLLKNNYKLGLVRQAKHDYIQDKFSIRSMSSRYEYLFKEIVNGNEWGF